MPPETDSPLNSAIRQFELAEANLAKLERLWTKIEAEIPTGIAFGESPDVENYCRSYAHILEYLPAIDGKRNKGTVKLLAVSTLNRAAPGSTPIWGPPCLAQ